MAVFAIEQGEIEGLEGFAVLEGEGVSGMTEARRRRIAFARSLVREGHKNKAGGNRRTGRAPTAGRPQVLPEPVGAVRMTFPLAAEAAVWCG